MQAQTENRLASASALANGINHPGSYYSHLISGQLNFPGAMYNQFHGPHLYAKPITGAIGVQSSVEDIAQAFTGINIQGYAPVGNGMTTGNGIPIGYGHLSAMNGMPTNSASLYPPSSWSLPDGRSVYRTGTSQPTFQPAGAVYANPALQGQYVPHSGLQNIPNTPHGLHWNVAQYGAQEVPELAAPRRNSLSSNEETGPQTPFFGAHPHGDYKAKLAISDHSPHAWSTPSPQQLGQPYLPQQLMKRDGQYTTVDLTAICMQDPSIPQPVPAIFSGDKGRGTLDKSLKNETNTTNVYIRGLHPDTTDDMLHAYGARFGNILSAKSMLDQQTGLCKGFGFIKYHNFDDGENCIRGFFHMGYEAKWARVSHNEKLKTLGDANNTNLYVSNLPLDFNENMLMSIFDEHEVLSAKILRDDNGMSRGVGFARFATPEICNMVIEAYSGASVGEEGNTLSIRFADTPDQKKLKSVTAERRQFKTNEYNTAAFGPGSPYLSPTTTSFPSPLQARSVASSTFWPVPSTLATVYPTYATLPAAYQAQTMASTAPFRTPGSENVAPNGRFNARVKIESPSVVAHAKRSAAADTLRSCSPTKIEVTIERRLDNTDLMEFKNCSQASRKSSPIKSIKGSPSKLSPVKSMYKASPSKSIRSTKL